MDKSIEEIERLRVKAANIIKTGSIISVSLSVLIAILTIISGNFFGIAFAFALLIIGLVITMIVSSKPSKEFKMAYKNTFVLKSLKSVFDDLEYNPEIGFHILSALLNIDYSEDVEELIAALNHANIKDKDYVKSCIFLLDVSKEVHKSYKEIEKMDKMYPFVAFVNDRYAKCSPHKEEIADNLSCILASHNQFFADLELNTKKSFECVLRHASWIRYYKDLEQLLFSFNCRLEWDGVSQNLYELSDVEHWLESLTYGFCKYETQSKYRCKYF